MTNHLFKDSYSKKSIMDAVEMLNNGIKDLNGIQNLFKNYYYDYREKAECKVSNVSTIKECKDPKVGTKPQTG
eukprot:CAMPEP_0168349946 /NCGR_PEP_ID=MMETSP0213-20121227/20782_1 /TAXON_ID=151035 /ORGANISM="Euplotes harpa, Strain FSP1.4" /LENGTH=72 /DNA_ID=CAMNT_0008360111 /DNA_START=831 /DNA_END=1049 /DNA_ORIENTATION=-